MEVKQLTDKKFIGEESSFCYPEDFRLELGGVLPGFDLHYKTYGELNKNKDNVIWVCHALTGNADVYDWWPGLFGQGKFYDPDHYFIICANTIGGCYGSTGPLSKDPRTNRPFYHQFPQVTNRDIVTAFDLLRRDLGLPQIHTLIGGSLGGQHILEWAIQKPSVVKNLVVVASNARHSPWGIAFNETQRMAIKLDESWSQAVPEAGVNGMKAGRAIALLSYRNYKTYAKTQLEFGDHTIDNFNASSYQLYQGEKLARRFNAYTYWILSKAMDSHNIGRNRGGIVNALNTIEANTLCIGIDSDILFPVQEQEFITMHIKNSTLKIISSDYGHDGFLIETNELADCIQSFYGCRSIKEPVVAGAATR